MGGETLLSLGPRDQLNKEGFQAHGSFKDVFILEKIQRQAAAGEAEVQPQAFFNLFPRAKDGQLTDEDWRELLHEKIRAIANPVLNSEAVSNCKTARCAPPEAANGSENDLYLTIGAKVMLIKHL